MSTSSCTEADLCDCELNVETGKVSGELEKTNCELELEGSGTLDLKSTVYSVQETLSYGDLELAGDDRILPSIDNVNDAHSGSINETIGEAALSAVGPLPNITERSSLSNQLENLDDLKLTGGSKSDSYKEKMFTAAANNVEKIRVFGGYAFNRDRVPNPELPANTVTVLNFPFARTTKLVGDNEDEYRKSLSDAKVYLVGTAHFSFESQQDVLKTIQNTQPDMVMVELCSSRISILSMDEESLLEEAKSLTTEKVVSIIKESGLYRGMVHVLLLSMSAHMTRELGMAPGGEFRAAHRGARSVKLCKLILGDRPIQVTLQRALSSLGFFQKLRLVYHIIISQRTKITLEEVEQFKKSDMLEELLKEMAGEFPSLSKIFVQERDLFITNSLHTILKRSTYEKWMAWRKTDVPWQPVSVVAVVGMGHVPGIVANWNKSIDVSDLLDIPQPGLARKVFGFVVQATFLTAAAYGAYRLGYKVIMKVIVK